MGGHQKKFKVILKILFHKEAEADFYSAFNYYSEIYPELGEKFINSINTTLEQVQLLPTAYPQVFRGIRKAVVAKFPYVILYKENNETIIVFAIFHTGRKIDQVTKRD